MNATTTSYGVDIAKSVMQVHWVEADTGEVKRRKLARSKFSEFFATRMPASIAMEACAGAHHWGRLLAGLGHTVELLPARQVRAFVRGNKDDAADARAIWLAAQHGDIRRVPVKNCQQQAALALHRTRSHWVCVRTATLNALRGLLYEFGVVLPKGKRPGLETLAAQRAHIDAQLPASLLQLLDEQLRALHQLEEHVTFFDKAIAALQKSSEAAKRLREVPGIGVLGATALAATLGDASAWRNGREFSCCLGLTPRHSGTGGKVRMGSSSKRGDPYLRSLLINGARAVVTRDNPPPWIARLRQRRPLNVVVVALANKLARTAWALIAHERRYERQWVSHAPAGALCAAR
jgi:transposase